MSQLTSQPNEPDRSDSTAPKQTTTSDARPPWQVEGARGPQETTRWRPPPKRPSPLERETLDEADAYAVAGIPRPGASTQPVVAQA
jgi:hypothetical protein